MKIPTRMHRACAVLAALSSGLLLQTPSCSQVGAQITKGLSISITNELVRNTVQTLLGVESLFSF